VLETALHTYLASKTGVTNLVATRIYKGYLPEGVAKPALVIDRVGGEPVYHQAGESNLAMAEIRFTAISASYGQAKAVIEAVRMVLSGLTGSIGSGADQVTVESCQRAGNEADGIDRPPDGSDAVYVLIPAIYTIWHRQAVPTL
jgi:hypothetical protein